MTPVRSPPLPLQEKACPLVWLQTTGRKQWSDMDSKVKTALRDNKCSKKGERLLMIRIVVDAMRKHNANPTPAQAAIVAKRIVRHNPDCFED